MPTEKEKRGRGRPREYDPIDIGWRTVQIIRTLGVGCTKSAVACAFYDTAFDPDRAGERERLESAYRKARKRTRQKCLVKYSELIARGCPGFGELVEWARQEPSLGLLLRLLYVAHEKKQLRINRTPYVLPIQREDLPKKKKG